MLRSRSIWHGAEGQDRGLGLSNLYLHPSLEEEMNRLFISNPMTAPASTPSPTYDAPPSISPPSSMAMASPQGTMRMTRRRLGSGDSGCGSSFCSSSTESMSLVDATNIFDFVDYARGNDFRINGLETDLDEIDQIIHKSRPTRAEELLGLGTAYRQHEHAPDILTKEHLLALLSRGGRFLKKKSATKKGMVCVFCRNNGEAEAIYQSHVLKDAAGRVLCPVLRAYTCPNCNASGDNAHTLKYCPLSNGDTPNIRALKTARTATGKKRLP